MQIVLETKGTYLRRKSGMLEIASRNFKNQKIALKEVESIVISPSIRISSDAILMLMKAGVDVIFTDKNGQPKGRIWNNTFGSVASIRRNQILYAHSPQATAWIKNQIVLKITAQKNLLFRMIQFGDWQNIAKIQSNAQRLVGMIDLLQQTNENTDNFYASLRGWEGTASRYYFEALSLALPPEYQFQKRSRKPAKDIFNALLNYLYGMLYTRVEAALIKAGIDPYLGIWHQDEYNCPVLTYDFIEPYRAWADWVAVSLCHIEAIKPNDVEKHNGGIWLGIAGKKIAISAFNDYMEEVIVHKLHRKSRKYHIFLDAQAFAQVLMDFKQKDS